MDSFGNVYIADSYAVREFTAGFETLGTIARTVGAGAGQDTVEIGFVPINAALTWKATTTATWLHPTASGNGGGVIQYSFDANPNAASRTGAITLDSGLSITVTQAGTSYVQATATTALATTGLNYPFGLTVDNSGNVFLADRDDNAIKEWNASTQTLSPILTAGLNHPRGVAVDGAGLLYIANSDAGAVTKYNPATQQSSAILSGLDYPWATALDAMGNVYVANSSANVINKWSPSTQQGPVLLSGLNIPWGVSVDTAGDLYVVDSYNQAVKRTQPWVATTDHTGWLRTLLSSGRRRRSVGQRVHHDSVQRATARVERCDAERHYLCAYRSDHAIRNCLR